MKNKNLANLLQSINAVGYLRGIKFAYCCAKNHRLITQELEIFNTLMKPPEELEKYEKKRLKLCEEYSKKNENGKSIMVNNEYIIADTKKFAIEHKKLKGTFNKKVFENREKQIKEFNEFLEKESSFIPFKVKMEDVPEDITTAELSGIFDLVEEEEKVKAKKK